MHSLYACGVKKFACDRAEEDHALSCGTPDSWSSTPANIAVRCHGCRLFDLRQDNLAGSADEADRGRVESFALCRQAALVLVSAGNSAVFFVLMNAGCDVVRSSGGRHKFHHVYFHVSRFISPSFASLGESSQG